MAKKSFNDMNITTRKILMAFESSENQKFVYIKTDLFGNRCFHKGASRNLISVSPKGRITSTKHEFNESLKRKIIKILEESE